MVTLAVWLVIATSVAERPASSAETVAAIHECADPCVNVGEGTNAEFKQCLSQWLDREKTLLDEHLARALAKFKERQTVARAIRDSQAAWDRYHDAQCKAAGLQYEGGSMQRTAMLACLARTTCERVRDLEYDLLSSNE